MLHPPVESAADHGSSRPSAFQPWRWMCLFLMSCFVCIENSQHNKCSVASSRACGSSAARDFAAGCQRATRLLRLKPGGLPCRDRVTGPRCTNWARQLASGFASPTSTSSAIRELRRLRQTGSVRSHKRFKRLATRTNHNGNGLSRRKCRSSSSQGELPLSSHCQRIRHSPDCASSVPEGVPYDRRDYVE